MKGGEGVSVLKWAISIIVFAATAVWLFGAARKQDEYSDANMMLLVLSSTAAILSVIGVLFLIEAI